MTRYQNVQCEHYFKPFQLVFGVELKCNVQTMIRILPVPAVGNNHVVFNSFAKHLIKFWPHC